MRKVDRVDTGKENRERERGKKKSVGGSRGARKRKAEELPYPGKQGWVALQWS